MVGSVLWVWCTCDRVEKLLWGQVAMTVTSLTKLCTARSKNVQEHKKCEHGTIRRVQPNTENFLKTAVKVPLLKWVVLAWLGYKTSCLAWSDDRITLGSFLAGYLDIISDTGNFRVISLVLCWADRRRPPGKSRAAA